MKKNKEKESERYVIYIFSLVFVIVIGWFLYSNMDVFIASENQLAKYILHVQISLNPPLPVVDGFELKKGDKMVYLITERGNETKLEVDVVNKSGTTYLIRINNQSVVVEKNSNTFFHTKWMDYLTNGFYFKWMIKNKISGNTIIVREIRIIEENESAFLCRETINERGKIFVQFYVVDKKRRVLLKLWDELGNEAMLINSTFN
jgi:hypothetical protein